MLKFTQIFQKTGIPQMRRDLTKLLATPHDFSSSNPANSIQPSPVPVSHSLSRATIPISDPKYSLRYLSPYKSDLNSEDTTGLVRIGKLLEDLDTFAVHISYKHNDSLKDPVKNTHPLGIVTALVDDVVISKSEIPLNRDLSMLGHVSWVGSSSMEIKMSIADIDDVNHENSYINAIFVMVARSPLTDKAGQVNGLERVTPSDKKHYAQGEVNKAQRIQDSKLSLRKVMPSVSESEIIHQNFVDHLDANNESFSSRVLKAGEQWMENAKLKSVLVAMPEHRNIHGKLFGGHIMRKAFELALANVRLYAGSVCQCVAIDDISFKNPVNIGSLFLLNSQVCY